MIVQCPQCRARFRVADEKVTERGVKMRCTKCSTVFRITRPHDRDAAPPPPAPDAPRVVPQLPQARSLMYGGALDHPDEVSEAEAALPGRIPAGAAAADPSNTGPMLTSPVPITGPVEIATTSTLSALPTLAGVPIEYEAHIEFKKRVPHAIGLIRTGDTVQYANTIIESA